MLRSAIVISASSDIGAALCQSWAQAGWKVAGTFRKNSDRVEELKQKHGVEMISCDLLDSPSLERACQTLRKSVLAWDVIVFAPGVMDPIGNFADVDFDAWENAVQVNMLRPLRLLHNMLPFRNSKKTPTVLFFAGAGTNNAAVNYSAYALSKIGLIKICELLDAEIPDVRFTIVGPGWVQTKIHESTLAAGEKNAGPSYLRTLQRFEENTWVSIDKVIECCNWLISSPSKGLGGRNFSVAFDRWGLPELEKALEEDANMFKLRRHKNDWRS